MIGEVIHFSNFILLHVSCGCLIKKETRSLRTSRRYPSINCPFIHAYHWDRLLDILLLQFKLNIKTNQYHPDKMNSSVLIADRTAIECLQEICTF